jgi:hypothetical protein
MINDAGQVAGFGLDRNTFEVHAFLANPLPANAAPLARGPMKLESLPSSVHKQLRHGPYF